MSTTKPRSWLDPLLVIKNSSDTEFPRRRALKINGATVTDDEENDATNVVIATSEEDSSVVRDETGTGAVNDVATTVDDIPASSVRFTGVAPIADGFTSGTAARRLTVLATGGPLVLANESVGSVAENRIRTGTGSSVTIPNGAAALLVYDDTTDRWRLAVGGGASGDPFSLVWRPGVATAANHVATWAEVATWIAATAAANTGAPLTVYVDDSVTSATIPNTADVDFLSVVTFASKTTGFVIITSGGRIKNPAGINNVVITAAPSAVSPIHFDAYSTFRMDGLSRLQLNTAGVAMVTAAEDLNVIVSGGAVFINTYGVYPIFALTATKRLKLTMLAWPIGYSGTYESLPPQLVGGAVGTQFNFNSAVTPYTPQTLMLGTVVLNRVIAPSVDITAFDIDWGAGNVFTRNLVTGANTFTFSNMLDGQEIVVRCLGFGDSTVDFGAVEWPGGVAPTQSPGGISVYRFTVDNAAVYGVMDGETAGVIELPDDLAPGDILYWDGATLVQPAPGTDGQVLTLSGGFPVWADPTGGGGGGGDDAYTTALALTMWNKGTFVPTTWFGNASAGTSDTVDFDDDGITGVTAGTPVDGVSPASFNGTTQYLSGTAFGSTIHGAEGFLIVLAQAASAATDDPTYAQFNPCLVSTFGGSPIQMAFSDAGLRCSIYDGSTWCMPAPIAASTGSYHVFAMAYDATTVYTSVDGSSLASNTAAASASAAVGAAVLRIGANYDASKCFQGDILEVIGGNIPLTQIMLDGIIADFATKYPSLGL